MTTLALSSDGQAVALLCSGLALKDTRATKPLSPTEWHDLALALRRSELDRPRDLLGLASRELQTALGVAPSMGDRLERLLSRGGQLAFEVERLTSAGIWLLTRADDVYPGLIRQRLGRTAPPVLFGAGSQGSLDGKAIAVVGSRDVDEAGLVFAEALGRRCARAQVAVVSGAARGVDAAAMQGALEGGGVVVGITVDPLERLVRRRDFRAHIVDGTLTLATPFLPNARWHAGNAMRRNRLIYALAGAAVVVASSVDGGGTRAGALESLKSRWVPLHVRDDGSPGNRQLISEGGWPLPPNGVEELDLEELLTDRGPASLLEDSAPRNGALTASGTSELDEGSGTAKGGALRGTPPDTRDELFELIWPALAQHLGEPRSVEDVAKRFEIVPSQARAWLKHAAETGLVDVKARPRRYVLPGMNQDHLFPPGRS